MDNVTEIFNEKWKDHLEKGHYGMDIYDSDVVDYVDKEFEKLKIEHPGFTYSQIKLKFGSPRVYLDNVGHQWKRGMDIENGITKILNRKKHADSGGEERQAGNM